MEQADRIACETTVGPGCRDMWHWDGILKYEKETPGGRSARCREFSWLDGFYIVLSSDTVIP